MNAASDREAWARIIDPEAWRALEGPWQDDSRWVSEDHRKNCLAERQGYALAKADALLALPSSREQRLVEALRLASDTLTAAIEVADQARDEWDTAPAGMKAGKILIALSGQALRGYRFDTDAIHANRQRIAALLAELGEQDRGAS
jgi:hypothetical protein